MPSTVRPRAGLHIICSKGPLLVQSPILLGPAKKVPTSAREHWNSRVNRVCVHSSHTCDESCCPVHSVGNLNSYEDQCMSLPCQKAQGHAWVPAAGCRWWGISTVAESSPGWCSAGEKQLHQPSEALTSSGVTIRRHPDPSTP